MSDMIKREDIKLAPKGRQCKIDRCELFNRLATITADDANDMKAKIYAVIQEMPALPERVIQPVHVHIDTEEILEKIREEYELEDEPQGDGIIVRSNMPPFKIAEPQNYCKKRNCAWWSRSLRICLAERNGLVCKYKSGKE